MPDLNFIIRLKLWFFFTVLLGAHTQGNASNKPYLWTSQFQNLKISSKFDFGILEECKKSNGKEFYITFALVTREDKLNEYTFKFHVTYESNEDHITRTIVELQVSLYNQEC